MPAHSLTVLERLQSPRSPHARYSSAVTSLAPMQYGARVTAWAGRSAGSASLVPIVKRPPGTATIPAVHGDVGSTHAIARLVSTRPTIGATAPAPPRPTA